VKAILRPDGPYIVFIPRKLSETGKRTTLYFKTKAEAELAPVKWEGLKQQNTKPQRRLPDIITLRNRRLPKLNDKKAESRRLLDKYGITLEQRDAIIAKQVSDLPK
jgi:hypothetical protein